VKKHFNNASEQDTHGKIMGADYSKPVTVVQSGLPGAPKEFVAYRLFKIDKSGKIQPVRIDKGTGVASEKASFHGDFYTDVGNYVDRLGIDRMAKAKLAEHKIGEEVFFKAWVRYRVKGNYEALKSHTRAVKDHYTDISVPGGATQYLIPNSWEVLDVVDVGARSTGGTLLPKPNLPPVKPGGGK
jgi:hypothetical protein